ncbi:MAG TPA: hypothetical protein PK773_01535, partial [Aminivibrio sp.]|nr:hypothetical protein [Aminivibrio sp.]
MEKKAVRATRKTRQLTTGHEVLLLFVAIFFIYNVNGRAIGCLDTAPASLLPFSILENHDLYLDQFHGYIERTLTYWVQEIDGHYLSSYPIVIPVLLTPLYVLPFLFIKAAHIPLDMSHYGFAMMVSMMEKLSASLIASFSVIFVFLAAKELVNRRTAVAVSLVFALATSTWTISGQGLWQHGLVELLLAMSVYLVLLNERQASNRIIAALGLVSGLLLFNRPVDGILLIPTICYILALKDRRIVSYLFALFISGAPFLYYNLHYFGNLFGGYAAQMTLFDFGPDMFTRFLGLLISPSRGLFIYTPVLLFSIVGFSRVFEIKNRNVRNYLLISGISVLSLVAVYATFEIWWAGWSYGPRFLTGTLPVLVMFLGLYLREIELDARRAKKLLMGGLFAVSLAWSVFAQFVGAFYYPNGGWNADLEEKLWDWKDTQIWRSFDAGMMPSRNYLREISKTVNLGPGTAAEQKPAEGWDETGLGRGESASSYESHCRNIRFGSRYLLLATGFDTTGKNPVLRLTWEGLDNSHPHYDGYVHILDGNGTLLENIAFHRRTPGTAPETLEAWWCDDVVLPQNAFRETVDAIALCLRERDGNLLESDGCGTDWGG